MFDFSRVRARYLAIAVLLIAQAALAWFVISRISQKPDQTAKDAGITVASATEHDQSGIRAIYKKNLLGDSRIDASDWQVEPQFFHYLQERNDRYIRALMLGHAADDVTLGYLTGLQIDHLGLLDTRVTAQGFKRISSLERLDWLELYLLKLTPDEISVIVTLPHLTSLRATGCDLDDERLKLLAQHQFKWLILTGNHKITDRGVESLVNQHCATIGLGATAVSDDVGATLVAMKELNKVELYKTKISDRIFVYLSKVAKLQWLDLSDTKITDQGLRSFKSQKLIKQLIVHHCPNLTRGALDEFRKRNPGCAIEREATMYDQ